MNSKNQQYPWKKDWLCYAFILNLWPEMILKSYEAAIERFYAKALLCNFAQNIEKEVVRFLVKLQERSMQLKYEWTSSKIFFKDFNQKFISPTLWNSHFHNTKFRSTPLRFLLTVLNMPLLLNVFCMKQQQLVLHFLHQKWCNITQFLFKYIFCCWSELLWRFILFEFCVMFFQGLV